jgi:hypothetical protein
LVSFLFQIVGEACEGLRLAKNGKIPRKSRPGLLHIALVLKQKSVDHHQLLSRLPADPGAEEALSPLFSGCPVIEVRNVSATSLAISFKPSLSRPRSSAVFLSFSPAFMVACFS